MQSYNVGNNIGETVDKLQFMAYNYRAITLYNALWADFLVFFWPRFLTFSDVTIKLSIKLNRFLKRFSALRRSSFYYLIVI